MQQLRIYLEWCAVAAFVFTAMAAIITTNPKLIFYTVMLGTVVGFIIYVRFNDQQPPRR